MKIPLDLHAGTPDHPRGNFTMLGLSSFVKSTVIGAITSHNPGAFVPLTRAHRMASVIVVNCLPITLIIEVVELPGETPDRLKRRREWLSLPSRMEVHHCLLDPVSPFIITIRTNHPALKCPVRSRCIDRDFVSVQIVLESCHIVGSSRRQKTSRRHVTYLKITSI
jgi:hypothetical protein